MRAINIDVYFENNMLCVRFDILDRDDTDSLFIDKSFRLKNLEDFAITQSKNHKGVGVDSQYQQFLKYALVTSDTSIQFTKDYKGEFSIAFFDVTHSEKIISINESAWRKGMDYKHTVTVFNIPPSFSYIKNLLACLSLYLNLYRIDSITFENREIFTKTLNEGEVRQREPSTTLLSLMNAILKVCAETHNDLYELMMTSLKALTDKYITEKKRNENYTFLDCIKEKSNYMIPYEDLRNDFEKIKEVLTMDFNIDGKKSIETITLANNLLFSKPNSKEHMQRFINSCEFLFKTQSLFKKNIVQHLVGKPDADGKGDCYSKNYTETLVLKTGHYVLKPSGEICIKNIDTNCGYINYYAPGKPNHLIFEKEFSWLGQYFGGEVKIIDNEIIFSKECIPTFIKLGFISDDLIKLVFYAYNRANFIVQCQLAVENKYGENLLKQLPSDVLPEIVKNSDPRFNSLPFGLFKHAVQHGQNDWKKRQAVHTTDCSTAPSNGK